MEDKNTPEVESYAIPSWNVDRLKKKVATINKKAAKLNCPPVVLTEQGTAQRIHPSYHDEVASGRRQADDVPHYTVHLMTLTGEGPKLAGWKFVGTLDHYTLPGSVIVKTVPGESVPPQFYHNDAVCDHCNKIRRRIETFVVEHDEGELKQVGRQCIRDFLGMDPAMVIRFMTSIGKLFESLADEESEFYGGGDGGRQDMYFDHIRVLEVTSAMIRTYGWCSRAMAESDYDNPRTPTSSDVSSYFFPPSDTKSRELWETWKKTIEFDKEGDDLDANLAIEWLDNQSSDNEYMHNLQVIAKADAVPSQMFGYWCSLMGTYQRAMERLRSQERTKKLNEHVGEVKKRQDFDVEVVKITHIDGQYGVVRLHKMLDNDGRTLTWFANTNPEMNVGEKYRIKGTVKKHDEYNEWKQTILTRVKVLEKIEK